MRKGLNNFLQKSGLNEIKILIIVLSIAAGLLIFISIAGEVLEGKTLGIDNSILKSLRESNDISKPAFPDWVTTAMKDITSLGSAAVIVLFTIIVSGYLLLRKQYYRLWLVLAATIGGALLMAGLKEFIGRTRPEVVTHLLNEDSLSFPSGHSMMSAVIYLTQAVLLSRIEPNPRIKIYIISVALFLTFLIGVSRIYIGVHYPTDVLAGWVAGISWALLCWYIATLLEKRTGTKI